MKLAVTIDVEEEGLFSGQYPSGDAPVANVRHLERLGGLMSDFGIRPTLFVTWQVARHEALMAHLLNLRDAWQGEIGAHLHHWNTPPLEEPTGPARKGPIDSEVLPQQLLRDRLNTLLDTLRASGAPCEAFRMGRFNLGPRMWAVLRETDIRVDASIAPMRAFPGGPDHMAAPWDPYYPDVKDPTRPGRAHILEVPLTIVPLLPWPRPMANHPAAARLIQWAGSLPAQPMWVGLRRLKAAAWLHRLRGGRVLTVFFFIPPN